MKKIITKLIICVVILIFTSCSEIKYRELYKVTDTFVENLYIRYESYGLSREYAEYTSDGQYRVWPYGRLINVRIERSASDQEYEDLLKNLRRHYKSDNRVNEVYQCEEGTIMIDCRN